MFNLKELAEARLARKSKVQPAAETLPAEVKIANSEASQTIPLEQEQVLLVDGTSVAKSVARILESKIETTDGVTHFMDLVLQDQPLMLVTDMVFADGNTY